MHARGGGDCGCEPRTYIDSQPINFSVCALLICFALEPISDNSFFLDSVYSVYLPTINYLLRHKLSLCPMPMLRIFRTSYANILTPFARNARRSLMTERSERMSEEASYRLMLMYSRSHCRLARLVAQRFTSRQTICPSVHRFGLSRISVDRVMNNRCRQRLKPLHCYGGLSVLVIRTMRVLGHWLPV